MVNGVNGRSITSMLTIKNLNEATHEQYMTLLEGIFEHSPWIAGKAEYAKPFSSLEQLHQEMVAVVKSSSLEQKLSLIKAHPNLGDRVAMTKDSVKEQEGAGLQDLTPEEYERFLSMNQRYMEKFNFPFILAVHGKNKHQIYEAMKTRIENTGEKEFESALLEIYKIAKLRLTQRFGN